MSPSSLLRRRPSAPLVVSFLALFVALGGAGWAAIRIPANSVGNAQLQNFSVGAAKLRPNSVGVTKIAPGAVGARQVNSSQVQLRVTSSCLIGAIQSLTVAGDVTCTPALPSEFGAVPKGATLGATPKPVASVSLPANPAGSSYVAIGNVQVTDVEGTGPQSVGVSCTMTVSGGPGTIGHFDANLGGSGASAASGTIPLILPVSILGSPQPLAISCAEESSPSSPAPSVNVTATIDAVQTAVNNDS
jgi:hypothetical protein